MRRFRMMRWRRFISSFRSSSLIESQYARAAARAWALRSFFDIMEYRRLCRARPAADISSSLNFPRLLRASAAFEAFFADRAGP